MSHFFYSRSCQDMLFYNMKQRQIWGLDPPRRGVPDPIAQPYETEEKVTSSASSSCHVIYAPDHICVFSYEVTTPNLGSR